MMNMNKKLLGVLVSMLLTSCTLFAEEVDLRKAIEAAYPKVRVESIVKTPYNGLYEVFLGGQIIYTDAKLNFIIVDGHLIEPKNKRDVTGERLIDLTRINFSTLPLDQAIKVVKGDGSRKLVVFSDPDCPYCKRLEQNELANISNVTIYTFLYPIPELHPDALNKSKAIWCASDRAKAWQNWVLNNQLSASNTNCDTPLAKVTELGKKLGVSSTPTLFFADGKRMLGAYPAKEIEKSLADASSKKK